MEVSTNPVLHPPTPTPPPREETLKGLLLLIRPSVKALEKHTDFFFFCTVHLFFCAERCISISLGPATLVFFEAP